MKDSVLLQQCKDNIKNLDYLTVAFDIIDKILLHASKYKNVDAIAIKELPGYNNLCAVYYTTKEKGFEYGSDGLGCYQSLCNIDIKCLTLEKTAEHYRELGFFTEVRYIEYRRNVVGTCVISWNT